MTASPYDSRDDTKSHIGIVQSELARACNNIEDRALSHDQSKLVDPEKAAFDVLTPRLKGLTYGSEEYRASLREMKPALEHHYAHNSHHPEHYQNGIDGMSALDLIEMLCDWYAAGKRHADGDFGKSLNINRKRFGISEQLFSILVNTSKELGYIPSDWKSEPQ